MERTQISPPAVARLGGSLGWFVLTLGAIAICTALGPPEKTLGDNVRVVYLHGAWVWAALAAFVAAGVVGLLGLLARYPRLHRWSRALGRAGLVFWISYLPISIWAMQTNWNGLFLSEPRWRLAVIFALGGLLMQIGLWFMENPAWASFSNLLFLLTLILALRGTENVMHPPSPLLSSNAPRIQLYFSGLFALSLAAMVQVARAFFRLDSGKQEN